ncbi:hypothetical protein QR680_011440 [Steinernema hermaphroditum]|uniref:Bromo domain-containing protein n=1 Tax=Steinernema hermaphroditum TaxID=289476 RepID=A0AA39HYI1_9BILA|nr:hypothetical protein QR680_011440 [Steinernema hermaphroditum]
MPVVNRRPFEPEHTLEDEELDEATPAFYLEETNEGFTDYDGYFERAMLTQSAVWSCGFTGKTNMLYVDAEESEDKSKKRLKEIAPQLAMPLWYILSNYIHRAKIDDAAADLSTFCNRRFFIGEHVYLTVSTQKGEAIVVGVDHNPRGTNRRLSDKENRGDDSVKLPEPEEYSYRLYVQNPESFDKIRIFQTKFTKCGQKNVYSGVDHTYMTRKAKFIHSKETLRLLMKCSAETKKDDNQRAPALRIRHLTWEKIFAGPEPVFPHTEKKQRTLKAPTSPLKKSADKDSKTKETPAKGKKKEDGRKSKGQGTIDKFFKPSEKSPKKNLTQRIAAQQEQIRKSLDLIEQTGRDVSRWRQTERLLNGRDMSDLSALIAEVQKAEAARKETERKAKEKEARQEWKKPRDDLECDDLKPMPAFAELKLPEWLSTDVLMRCMALCQFIDSFSSLMNLKEHLKSNKITLDKVLLAVMCNDANFSTFVPIMQALLTLRAECGAEEDGDEADPKDMNEANNDMYPDFEHPDYGEQIRDATERHQLIRDALGDSPRDLPIDWMTITEWLRVNLITAGYYSGPSVQKFRMQARGGCHLYDDPCFRFLDENPGFLTKFETMSVFEMDPEDRLKLLELSMEQLLTYRKLRSLFDEQAEASVNLARERRNLRKWFAAEEQNATQIQQEIENGSHQQKKQTETTTKIVRYVKNVNEGRRVHNTKEVEALLLKDVHYHQMDLAEIVAVREFQKELFERREAKLTAQLEKTNSMNTNCYLGQDRAYYSYYFMDSLNLLLRLSPIESDKIPECSVATPVEKLPKGISRADYLKAIYACTGSKSTCHAHKYKEVDAQEVSYFSSVSDFETFISALNPRGYRESQLADNIAPLKQRLITAVTKFAEDPTLTEIEEHHLNPDTPLNWSDEVAQLLLDLEEKLYNGGIAQLPYDRDQWRQKLSESFNTTSFINPETGILPHGSDESFYTPEQLQELSTTQRLSIALLQLVQCIKVGFFNYPFAEFNVEKPWESQVTECYGLWQKELIAAHSLTEICMFYKRVTAFVRWEASRFQAKCRSCRKRGDVSELAICVECTRATHIGCLRQGKMTAVPEGTWTCMNCKRRFARADGTRGGSVAESVGDEEEPMDDDYSDVVYKPKAKTKKDRLIVSKFEESEPKKRKYYYDMDEDGEEGESEEAEDEEESQDDSQSSSQMYENGVDEDENFEPAPKRTRPSRRSPAPTRIAAAVMHNLRRKQSGNKESLKKVEAILRETLRREESWPFAQPVDVKEVPDYREFVKKPMDLRTMMNKLKNNDYESVEEVVADYQLMFNNCRTYNGDDSEITELAKTLETFMNEQFDALKAESISNAETGSRRERRTPRVIYSL